MRVKEVTLGAGRTVNTGNYNNVKVETTVTLEISDEDDLDLALRQGWAMVQTNLEYQLAVATKRAVPTQALGVPTVEELHVPPAPEPSVKNAPPAKAVPSVKAAPLRPSTPRPLPARPGPPAVARPAASPPRRPAPPVEDDEELPF